MKAFEAGKVLIAAGEDHRELVPEEEARVWERHRVRVYREEEPLPVSGPGATREMRMDGPFLHLLVYAGDLCGALTDEHITQWLADTDERRRGLLVGELITLRTVGGTMLGYVRAELQVAAWPNAATKLATGELIHSYLSNITDAVRALNANAALRHDIHAVNDLAGRVSALRIEIKKAVPLESKELAQYDTDLGLVRSAGMLERLVKWGPSITPPAIWKVGQSHIRHFPPGVGGRTVQVMPHAVYLGALIEVAAEAGITVLRQVR
jgi:hypothetical protein